MDAPDVTTRKGKRDRALLALLVGCGLRRAEAAALTLGHFQKRAGRTVILDLRGKHGRLRTVTVPAWVEEAVTNWCAAAGVVRPEERVLRSVRGRKVREPDGAMRYEERAGKGLTPQAVLLTVGAYTRKLGLAGVSPHDLRRTYAKLCRGSGADLEQIQMLLGHASIQTTERYLGSEQHLEDGPNDHLDLPLKK